MADESELIMGLVSGIVAIILSFKILLGKRKQQHPGKLIAL